MIQLQIESNSNMIWCEIPVWNKFNEIFLKEEPPAMKSHSFFVLLFFVNGKYKQIDMNSSKWTSWLGFQKRCVSWPDGYNLTGIKWYAVHLGDEDGCDGLVQSCSIHVDGGTNREHETSDSLVDGQVLFQAAEGDGKGSSADGGVERGRQVWVTFCVNCVNLGKVLDLLSSDLEAVPRAVIQAWKMPRKKVKGFFLTITK